MSRSGTVTMRGIVCLLEQALTGPVRFFLFFLSDPLRIPFCENDGKFSVSRFILSTYVCIPFFFLLFLSFVYSLLLNSQSELLLLLSFLLAKLSLLENNDVDDDDAVVEIISNR